MSNPQKLKIIQMKMKVVNTPFDFYQSFKPWIPKDELTLKKKLLAMNELPEVKMTENTIHIEEREPLVSSTLAYFISGDYSDREPASSPIIE